MKEMNEINKMKEQKTAVVTGASRGIGLAVCRTLLEQGMKVYGFGRKFFTELSDCPAFVPIACDLTQIRKVTDAVRQIRKETRISLLVNNAGTGYFGPHEELNPDKIHEMTTVNLEIPMTLTQLFLRDLKAQRGTIINISSVTALQANTHGCAYGATKAGLTSFSRSLFEEVRKYGVKVAVLHPDMTATDFYRHASFRESEEEDARLLPGEVADAVAWILSMREGMNITEMTIRPQRHIINRTTKKKEGESYGTT